MSQGRRSHRTRISLGSQGQVAVPSIDDLCIIFHLQARFTCLAGECVCSACQAAFVLLLLVKMCLVVCLLTERICGEIRYKAALWLQDDEDEDEDDEDEDDDEEEDEEAEPAQAEPVTPATAAASKRKAGKTPVEGAAAAKKCVPVSCLQLHQHTRKPVQPQRSALQQHCCALPHNAISTCSCTGWKHA